MGAHCALFCYKAFFERKSARGHFVFWQVFADKKQPPAIAGGRNGGRGNQLRTKFRV